MSDYVEKWVKQITKAIANGEEPHISSEGYPAGASSIVEPWYGQYNNDDKPEVVAYYDFIETDSWAPWIKQTFGDEWGLIAQIVYVEGY
jgi:hypothetical protein